MKMAEKKIAGLDALAVKEEDTLLYTFFYSKIIPIMIGPLAKTGISPNHITCLSVVLTILACLTLISEINLTLRITLVVVLLQLSLLLDCVDGALARETHSISRFGAWFDQITDRIKEFLLLFFISYYHSTVTDDESIWILGFITLSIVYLFNYSGDTGTAVPRGAMQIYTRRLKLKLNYFVPTTDVFNLVLSLGLIFNRVSLAYAVLSIACGLYAIIRGIVSWTYVRREIKINDESAQ